MPVTVQEVWTYDGELYADTSPSLEAYRSPEIWFDGRPQPSIPLPHDSSLSSPHLSFRDGERSTRRLLFTVHAFTIALLPFEAVLSFLIIALKVNPGPPLIHLKKYSHQNILPH